MISYIRRRLSWLFSWSEHARDAIWGLSERVFAWAGVAAPHTLRGLVSGRN
jgi:hypothetical protein